MDKTNDIARVLAPTIEAMGFDIVRVCLAGRRKRTLQVMVERRDGAGVKIDDCAQVSRVVSAVLDVANPIEGEYDLEISSPGIDRPLVRPADYQRFAGHLANIETRSRIDGRRRFRGRLLGSDGDRVRIAIDSGDLEVPFADISAAKLILTDELIAGTAR